MRQSIKKRVAVMTALFLGIFSAAIFLIVAKDFRHPSEVPKNTREQIIALNEIEKLTEQEGVSPAKEQIKALEQELRSSDNGYDSKGGNKLYQMLFLMWLICVMFMLLFVWYLYRNILRPFEKLEQYAGEIAKGNLQATLEYERSNPFGVFTWAFDHMRREIIKARACEKEAIENNKTVIATLSHDIKTPVSSIRAYAEGLEANMDSTLERRQRYLSVIMKKCDEVTKLTNDLFLHSLSDLDKLQIQQEIVEMKPFLLQAVREMCGEKDDIVISGDIVEMQVQADSKRLAQVLENIVNNARKYGKGTSIHLWTAAENRCYEIHIKDGGKGILPEDMPFIFEKFYRGKNVGTQPGAGLGLYIVKYIMNQMDGEVRLKNEMDGLEVVLEFLVSNSEEA